MPTNNFKPFSIASNANVISQADYEALAALAGGFTAGKASSAQINKALRQGTVMSSVLAQFIVNLSGKDVLDNGDTQTIINNFLLALKANGNGNYLQKTNNLSEIKDAGVAAGAQARQNLQLERIIQTSGDTQVSSPDGRQYLFVSNDSWGVFNKDSSGAVPLPVGTGGTGSTTSSGARQNLGLGDAATKNTGTTAGTLAAGNDSRITGAVQKANNLSDLANTASARGNLGLGTAATATVGTGVNQIPDMNSFSATTTWFKLPSGKIVQMGVFSTTTSGNTIINFPIPFPTACRSIVVTQQDTTFPNITGCVPVGTTQFRTTTWNYNGGAVSGTSVAYIAIGD